MKYNFYNIIIFIFIACDILSYFPSPSPSLHFAFPYYPLIFHLLKVKTKTKQKEDLGTWLQLTKLIL